MNKIKSMSEAERARSVESQTDYFTRKICAIHNNDKWKKTALIIDLKK